MSALSVTCPKCGALPGARCRTPKTQRTTDTHIDRINVGARRRTEEQA